MGRSAALRTFELIAYVNYLVGPLSSGCSRKFFFLSSSSARNEGD
jgi:hypothetical protein